MNIKKLILEAAQEIEQEIADGTLKIGEAVEVKDKGASGISKEYGGGLRIFGTVNGEKRSAKLKKEEIQKWSTMTPQQKEDLYKNYLVTNFDPKAQTKEATVVISTPTGAAPTDPIKKKQAMDATKVGDTVKYVKPGLAEETDEQKSNSSQRNWLRVNKKYYNVKKDQYGNEEYTLKPEKVIAAQKAWQDTTNKSKIPDWLKKITVGPTTEFGSELKEATGQDLLLYLAQLLAATSLSTWAGFSWAKGLLAIPDFKKELEAAKSKEDKVEVIKGALSHVMNPTDTGSYKDSLKEAADEPTDAEQDEPAEEQGSISDKLSELISQAIDAAGQVISGDPDKKMESALGRVIKNLTAAQDSLIKVSEHETKLSEKVEAETAKNLEKYTKDFLKGLRKYTKDDALINKFRRTYDPLVAAAMKAEKPVDEVVGTAWKHFTLSEGKK